MKLKGKVIIVVGASGGIGSVLSREFHREGATIILAARTKKKLDNVASKLGSRRTIVMPVDATDSLQVRDLFNRPSLVDRIDAVVISAGTWARLIPDASVTSARDWAEKHFKNIFLPSFVVGFVAQQFFRSQGHGLIVNISSHAAVRPELKGNLTYSPMKAAARHFMLALRTELAGTKVRVTDIQPAIVNTPDNVRLLDTPEKRAGAVQPEAIAEWIIEHFDDPNIPAELLLDSSVVV